MDAMAVSRIGLLAIIVAAAASVQVQAAPPFSEQPTVYAEFAKDKESLTLVVAELLATDYLKGYGCPPLSTTSPIVCLGSSPYWFKARVIKTVAGPEVGDEFYAVTGTHWRAMNVGAGEPPRLMLLNSNGVALEMVRYASWPAIKSKDGQYHLILQSSYPPRWLPCWIYDLKQELDPANFADDLTISHAQYQERFAEDDAAYYRVTQDRVRPRFEISVARLQQTIKQLPAPLTDFTCKESNAAREARR